MLKCNGDFSAVTLHIYCTASNSWVRCGVVFCWSKRIIKVQRKCIIKVQRVINLEFFRGGIRRFVLIMRRKTRAQQTLLIRPSQCFFLPVFFPFFLATDLFLQPFVVRFHTIAMASLATEIIIVMWDIITAGLHHSVTEILISAMI